MRGIKKNLIRNLLKKEFSKNNNADFEKVKGEIINKGTTDKNGVFTVLIGNQRVKVSCQSYPAENLKIEGRYWVDLKKIKFDYS